MYIRHDDAGIAIYVPEDVPDRDFVPTGNVRSVDPPTRRHFINNLPPHKRATAPVRGYVESRVGCKNAAESKACRGFLRAWHEIDADGNEMGIDLAIMPSTRNAVQFYFHIHGVGPVVWLPVLVTASNDRTSHIMRETGPDRVAIAPPPRGPVDPDNQTRRRIPPKVGTVLVTPKRP